jgi:hypothetical protein
MRAITKSTTDASGGAKSTGVVALDTYKEYFSVTVRGNITGTATVEIQYTMDDPFASTFTDAGADWVKHDDFAAAGATEDFIAVFDQPVRAIRGYQTAGNGSCAYIIVQAG